MFSLNIIDSEISNEIVTLKRRLFEDAGRVSFVDLQDHGRASIRFETAYDAERAVSRFNGYMIEGYSLYARISDM